MQGPANVGTGPRERQRLPLGWLVLLAVLVGAGWVAFGSTVQPMRQTCDPTLAKEICLGSIDAALRRGMPAIHPLLLEAHATPGPAARPDQFGHRATITFGVLGVGQPASVRLFFDAGGHWAGVADTATAELAFWAIAQGIIVALIVAGALGLVMRVPRHRARSDRTLG